ncbi:MAG: NAD-dependent epimerase/dehydratase family protein [Hyphomicrobiales bacterium]|nr:NAD-dependent epimerase/dehydratase family protein [Hyphomicrobiales bacterium]
MLITGATGLIGRALTRSFLEDRTPVTVVSRNPSEASDMFQGRVRAVEWSPAASPFPHDALAGVDTVFHLMGEPVGGRWTAQKRAEIVASRVTAAAAIAEALKGRSCRFVSASSFGIYRGRAGEVYDETDPLPAPASEVQAILQSWEAAALAASSPQTRVNVVRFGMVCAPDGYPKKLVRLFKKGFGFVAGDGRQIVPIVALDDAVGMLRWAASGQAGDGAINCVAPQLPTFRDVATCIAETLRAPLRFRVPNWIARPILGGSADYFLLSYDVKPRVALNRGYNFRMSDPMQILRDAILGGEALAAR